jgi:hypothetical protein
MAKRRYRFSERLLGRSRRRYFACGRIVQLSDHMQSISEDEPLAADDFVILYAPNYLGAHKMMQRRFVFPNSFPVDLDNGTLNAVVSYHDPTTSKVSSENIGWLPTFWPFGALASTCEHPIWPNVVYIVFKPLLDDSN